MILGDEHLILEVDLSHKGFLQIGDETAALLGLYDDVIDVDL
jgi:hypothetical protein